MRIALLIAAGLVIPVVGQADDSDDTLKYFLAKSDLVDHGTIKTEPLGLTREAGVPNDICDFEVWDVLKGDEKLKSKTIHVTIKRFEMAPEDHHPLIKKDAECILFLKQQKQGTNPNWATADFWFGIQRASPWMVKSLNRLADQSSRQQ